MYLIRLIGSVDKAISNVGALLVANTSIAGNAGVAIVNGIAPDESVSAATADVRGSSLFRNQGGIVNFGSLSVSGTIITDHQGNLFGGINHFSSEGVLDVDATNLIVGNTSVRFGDRDSVDVAFTSDVFDASLPLGSRNRSIGDLEDAEHALSLRTVSVDLNGTIITDEELVGVNVNIRRFADGRQQLEGSRDRTLLFRSVATGELLVSLADTNPYDSIVADELRDLDFVKIAGVDRIGLGQLVFPEDFTIGDRNAWSQLTITSVESLSGNSNIIDVLDRSFGHDIPDNFRGNDSIRVTGVGRDGIERTGVINVQVEGSGVELDVRAVERANSIEVSLVTQGLQELDSFNVTLRFNPEVVRFVSGKVSAKFPHLNRAVEETTGVVSISGQRGFLGASTDLGTLRFERISEGSAGIEIAADLGFYALADSKTLPFRSVSTQYQAFDGFDTNRDGSVSALDALVVINRISRGGGQLEASALDANDANGDGQITALDALQVINRLARQGSAGAEGERTPNLIASAVYSDSVMTNWSRDDDEDDDVVLTLF